MRIIVWCIGCGIVGAWIGFLICALLISGEDDK